MRKDLEDIEMTEEESEEAATERTLWRSCTLPGCAAGTRRTKVRSNVVGMGASNQFLANYVAPNFD